MGYLTSARVRLNEYKHTCNPFYLYSSLDMILSHLESEARRSAKQTVKKFMENLDGGLNEKLY